MAQLEPMDVDDINDNKENAFIPNNVFRGQENAEVLDSSEYHMKLRYSNTPISSPMSKSYTVTADKNNDDTNNCNMTQSLNLMVTKSETDFTGPKSLPLQTIPLEDAADKTINVLKQLDSLISDNGDVTITVSKALDDDENVSLPSSSSATPEAVTPTKEIPKPIGSPILRGIQSVFKMFRTSQSPVSLNDDDEHASESKSSLEDSVVNTENSITASTPLNIHKKSDSISSRDSKDRENPVFSEKLEKDLEWNETTIIFSKEKFPIHKLLFQQCNAGPLPDSSTVGDISMASVNESYEAMDVSCNDSVLNNKTLQGNNVTSKLATDNLQSNEITGSEKDESVFLDCETTLNESQDQNIDKSNRTHDKTLNDTSFISMQSAETVTCTSDMSENLIVSESFVQDNKDINPIAVSNIALEESDEPVSHADLSGPELVQEAHKIVIESQINTTDKNTINLDVTDKDTIDDAAIQCQVNIVDEKFTEANVTRQYDTESAQGSHEIVIESRVTYTTDENNIKTEVNDKSQSSMESTQKSHKIVESKITATCNVTELNIEEVEKSIINDDVMQSILHKNITKENMNGQFDTKKESEVHNESAAGEVCTDSNVFQSETKPSTLYANEGSENIHLTNIDSLENDKSKKHEQPDEANSEPNISENNITQNIKSAGLPHLVSDIQNEELHKQDIVISTQDVTVEPPKHDIENEIDTTIDAQSFPAVVDIKPDGSLIIITEDKESFEIPTPSEDISMVKDDMLVPEDEQEQDFGTDRVTKMYAKKSNKICEDNISAACVKSGTGNQETEWHKLREDQSKDEEIILSESNSPYVSLGHEVAETESLKEDIITSPKLKSKSPEFPKITSVGYNFNFDEINPFATRTRLSISPTKQVSTDKAIKSPVVSQIMESFPKIYEEILNIPAANTVNEQKFITAESKTSMISKDEIIKAEITNSQTILADNKCNESLTLEESKCVEMLLPNTSNKINLDLASNATKDEIKEDLSTKDLAPEVTPALISKGTLNELNAQTTSTSSQFYSMGASSCEVEALHGSSITNTNETLQNIKSEICTINPVPAKADLQQPAEQNDQTVEGYFALSDDFNKTVDIHMDDKANTTVVTDNAIDLSVTCSDDKDVTVREVHTEDEDTAEGPNIESQIDSKDDCFSGFVSVKSDCGILDDLPPEAKDEAFEPIESAEMFIDAEAFDFLMSQNRSNEVISSGKESLFLKFDPLFAKRVNSDGVLDILSKVQKRQSTPKKLRQHQSIMDMSNEEKPGPSSVNQTFHAHAHDITSNTRSKPQLGDFDETLNENPKPTMIVTPVVPKHNLKTPSRSIRRSSGVHSPALAVIDRLLSISANSPMAYDDTTVIHYNAEQEEADRALIELRDLVAVKELEVYQLKCEGKELKDRLFSLESQMENLDRESEKRLKAINALNEQLNEKDKINKSMKDVVEEYEKTIAGLISEIESDKKRNAEEKIQLIRERDEQTAHLANMEGAFSDLHSKYEKSKQIILSYKANEDAYKKSIEDFEASLIKMEKTYDALKKHATAQLDHANQELEKINKSHESEVVKLKAMIKRKDLHITSLEENIAQKIKANEELTSICDELISKVG